MSDARQIVSSVEKEFSSISTKKNQTIEGMIFKAKEQLALAKEMLKVDNYKQAKIYANKAKNLAKLARLEIQQQLKK